MDPVALGGPTAPNFIKQFECKGLGMLVNTHTDN